MIEDARPGRGPVDRACKIVVSAEGVKGGVMRRRESFVVCALIRDAQSWARERGFMWLLLEMLEMLAGRSLLVGGSADWSCVRSAERPATVDFKATRSCSALLVEPGMFTVEVVFWWLSILKFVIRGGENNNN